MVHKIKIIVFFGQNFQEGVDFIYLKLYQYSVDLY